MNNTHFFFFVILLTSVSFIESSFLSQRVPQMLQRKTQALFHRPKKPVDPYSRRRLFKRFLVRQSYRLINLLPYRLSHRIISSHFMQTLLTSFKIIPKKESVVPFVKKPPIFHTPPDTFIINLMLPEEEIINQLTAALKQKIRSEEPFSPIAHFIILTGSGRPYILEITEHKNKKNPLGIIVNSAKKLLSPERNQLDAYIEKQITQSQAMKNLETEKNIILLVDLSKPQKEMIEEVKNMLNRYKNNTSWQTVDIIFLLNQKTTLFQISREKNSYPIEKISEKLVAFLQHKTVISESIEKIQKAMFSDFEQLVIKTNLHHIFTP